MKIYSIQANDLNNNISVEEFELRHEALMHRLINGDTYVDDNKIYCISKTKLKQAKTKQYQHRMVELREAIRDLRKKNPEFGNDSNNS